MSYSREVGLTSVTIVFHTSGLFDCGNSPNAQKSFLPLACGEGPQNICFRREEHSPPFARLLIERLIYMTTYEWQTEEAEEPMVDYPTTVDLWQVERLLNDLLAEMHEHPSEN